MPDEVVSAFPDWTVGTRHGSVNCTRCHSNPVSLVRRPLIAIALLFAFAAQLVLSGASAACAMPSTEQMAARAGSDAAMPGMAMAGSHERDDHSRAPRDEKGSCDTQLPAAVCQLMSACTVAAITASTDLASTGPRLTSGAIPFVRTSPPQRSTAPELPPPRA